GGSTFAILYHVAGLMGNLLHFLLDPSSLTIVVGASGAVFGIIAAFAVLFPLRPIFALFFLPLLLPVALLAILYFLIEIIYELSGLNPYVAHWAHIGGLLAGFAFALVYKAVSRHSRQRGKEVKIVWVEG
ncbi:rhomboid family intramembrane serine protease, partial [bacterium]